MRQWLAAAGVAWLIAAPAAVSEAANGLRATFSGVTVYRVSGIAGSVRGDVWKFKRDGTFTGYAEIGDTGVHHHTEDFPVRGRWSVENNTLCLEGQGLEFARKRCFRISKAPDPYDRESYFASDLTGDYDWEMLIER